MVPHQPFILLLYVHLWQSFMIHNLRTEVKNTELTNLILQSASWYCFWAFTLQCFLSKYANENLCSCKVLAAWPVSNILTMYNPKSLISHPMSISAPCSTCKYIIIMQTNKIIMTVDNHKWFLLTDLLAKIRTHTKLNIKLLSLVKCTNY